MYKNYLSDVGLTYYDNMEAFFSDFTFLTDPNCNQHYLYEYDTNWQDQIYRNSTTMDYLFRVEGGDNIAKYNISLGYLGDKGTLATYRGGELHHSLSCKRHIHFPCQFGEWRKNHDVAQQICEY